MEDPAICPPTSVEEKIDSLAEQVTALNRRHCGTTYILTGAMIVLLLSSAPSLMLYEIVGMHFRMEAFVNESIVALVFVVVPLSSRWIIDSFRDSHQ